jgi:hypothetical protein
MSNSVHLSDMSRVPDQRCFRPFRNRQSAARSVLPNWQLPLTFALQMKLSRAEREPAVKPRDDRLVTKSIVAAKQPGGCQLQPVPLKQRRKLVVSRKGRRYPRQRAESGCGQAGLHRIDGQRLVHIFIDFGQLCSSKPATDVHGNRPAVFMISATRFQAGQHTCKAS